MSKYLSFVVNLVTKIAIAIAISLGMTFPALAVTQELQFNTATGYVVRTVFSYDGAQNSHPEIIHEQGKGKTNIIESMRVSFYQPSGELIASYDNIVDGVARGNYFEFNFEPKTQQLIGNIDLGGESTGEIYLKGNVDRQLSLIEVEPSGEEKAIDLIENRKSS